MPVFRAKNRNAQEGNSDHENDSRQFYDVADIVSLPTVPKDFLIRFTGFCSRKLPEERRRLEPLLKLPGRLPECNCSAARTDVLTIRR